MAQDSTDDVQYQGASFDPQAMRQQPQNQAGGQQPAQPPNQQNGAQGQQTHTDISAWGRQRLEATVREFASKLQSMQEHQRKLLYAYRINRDFSLSDEEQSMVSKRLDACDSEKALKSEYEDIAQSLSSEGGAPSSWESGAPPPAQLVRSLYEERTDTAPPPEPTIVPSSDRVNDVAAHIEALSEAYAMCDVADSTAPANDAVHRALSVLSELVIVAYAAAYEHGFPLEHGVHAAYQSALVNDDSEVIDRSAFSWTNGLRSMDAAAVIEEYGFNFSSFDQYVDAISTVLAGSDLDRAEAVRAASKVVGTGDARAAFDSGVMPRTFLEKQGAI